MKHTDNRLDDIEELFDQVDEDPTTRSVLRSFAV